MALSGSPPPANPFRYVPDIPATIQGPLKGQGAGVPYRSSWSPPGHGLGYEHGFTRQVVLVRAIDSGTWAGGRSPGEMVLTARRRPARPTTGPPDDTCADDHDTRLHA